MFMGLPINCVAVVVVVVVVVVEVVVVLRCGSYHRCHGDLDAFTERHL